MIDSTTLHVIKAVLSTLGFFMLLTHMFTSPEWDRSEMSMSRKLRYLALLFFSVTLIYASQDLAKDHVPFQERNWFAMAAAVMLVAAAAASLWDDHKKRVRDKEHTCPRCKRAYHHAASH